MSCTFARTEHLPAYSTHPTTPRVNMSNTHGIPKACAATHNNPPTPPTQYVQAPPHFHLTSASLLTPTLHLTGLSPAAHTQYTRDNITPETPVSPLARPTPTAPVCHPSRHPTSARTHKFKLHRAPATGLPGKSGFATRVLRLPEIM
jgi:hypothetical protein